MHSTNMLPVFSPTNEHRVHYSFKKKTENTETFLKHTQKHILHTSAELVPNLTG